MNEHLEELKEFTPKKQEIDWSSVTINNHDGQREENPKILAQCCNPGPCSPKW